MGKTFDEILSGGWTTNGSGRPVFSSGLFDDDELLALYDLATDYSPLLVEYDNGGSIADRILYSAGLHEEADDAEESDDTDEGKYFLVLERAVAILRARKKP